MKLDLLKRQWIDIVFEGKNKAYGAYELRKENPKTTMQSLLIGGAIFALAVASPLIIDLIPSGKDDDESLNQKIVTVKLPPKEQEKPKDLPPPPPPPPKVDQVKFVKPVVAKTEDVVEEIVKVEDIKDKKLGNETIKGDPDAPLTVEDVGTGPVNQVVEEDTQIYNTAGIQVQPEFPGGMDKFYKFVGKNFQVPEEEGLKGKVFVTFVVEKDGSLTDIKVIRDIGYGTGKEAIRVLKSCPKWVAGEQNGKKVRVQYSLPITIQSAE
jgi:protein TonB